MKGKGKICRIDDWDKPEAVKYKSWSHQERLCDLKEKVSLHKRVISITSPSSPVPRLVPAFQKLNSRRNLHHSLQRERVSFSTASL